MVRSRSIHTSINNFTVATRQLITFLDVIIKIQTTTCIKIRNSADVSAGEEKILLFDGLLSEEVSPHGEEKEIAPMGKNLTLKWVKDLSLLSLKRTIFPPLFCPAVSLKCPTPCDITGSLHNTQKSL
jgi:hypothetical protein